MELPVQFSQRIPRRSALKAGALILGGMFAPASTTVLTRAQTAVLQQANLPCGEGMQHILEWALTLEAVTMTYYYTGITRVDGFFRRLPDQYQQYLRAMLAEEQAHYEVVRSTGATSTITGSFFPSNSLGFDDFSRFLATLHTLETISIGFYLVAARRCAEQGQGQVTALCGQIAGVEAEHRVIGREMSLAPPDPRNDVCFQRATLTCVSQIQVALAPFLSGDSGSIGPLRPPDSGEVAAALGDVTCTAVAPAGLASCSDSLADLVDVAAVAEAVGIAFYYAAVQAKFFKEDDKHQWYLQAALDEERNHLAFLLAQGAATPPTQFFFPQATFTDLTSFLQSLDTLENLFIGAYLTTMQQFVQLNQPLLAEIVGQILGVEAEHRALGRVIAGQDVPHDRCLQPTSFRCLANIVNALDPFVLGNATHTQLMGLPGDDAIAAAVGRFGCATVALAVAPPQPVYLPTVIR